MAKNSIRDYSATNSSNTDIQSIDISEGCSPAGINNAIREVMADLKDVSTGTVALESPSADSLTVTGDLTVDTSTLYVDSTNNRVGVRTASPAAPFEVSTGGADYRIMLTNVSGLNEIRSTESDQTTYTTLRYDASAHIFENSNAEAMRITGGNVGIGTSSPNSLLHISSAGSTILNVEATGANDSRVRITAGNANISYVEFADPDDIDTGEIRYDHSTNHMGFRTNGNVERMRIDSSGNLLVGTTSASRTGVQQIYATSENSYTSLATESSTSSNIRQIRFYNPNGEVGYISTSGTSTAYNTSSDYRLKENVVADWDATTRLKQLNPVRFNFIADPDTTVDGFLAHEVQDVVPEAISGTHDEVETWTQDEIDAGDAPANTSAGDNKLDDDGNTIPVYQGIDQSKLVPLLVKTIQELEARIAALENA